MLSLVSWGGVVRGGTCIQTHVVNATTTSHTRHYVPWEELVALEINRRGQIINNKVLWLGSLNRKKDYLYEN